MKNGTELEEDNEQLKYEYHHIIEKDKPSLLLTKLEIKNITMEDAANYTCRAHGYGMTSFRTVLLEVGMVNYSYIYLVFGYTVPFTPFSEELCVNLFVPLILLCFSLSLCAFVGFSPQKTSVLVFIAVCRISIFLSFDFCQKY